MGRIRLLPDALVNKIAAGEVVERPASVVKELLENALDAGAGRILVEVDDGGRTRILCEDNGCGMDPDDLLMALERHATSKLEKERDLFAIATLGFRGEALPSIASVSRFTLESRPREAPSGHRVRVEGGRFKEHEPAALPPGTRAEVRNLFFNVPARRKFLKAPATELSHVVLLLEHYALARPDVAFRLRADGRDLLNLAPAASREERFFDLFPDLPREDFLPLRLDAGDLQIRGLAGKPERNLGSARYQFTLANGRFIRDRLVQHAVGEAYADTLPRGRFPLYLLVVTLPFDKVDVNVHPTKREVRFAEGPAVHGAVVAAFRRALFPGRAEAAPRPAVAPPSFPPAVSEPAPTPWTAPPAVLPGLSAPASGGHPPPGPLRVLCQWRGSFALCDGPEGLSIVDQHVAHERLRFEQFRRFLQNPGPRQGFLAPHLFRLPRELHHRTEEVAALASAQGFEAEAWDDGTVAVRSAPAFLGPREAEELLEDLFASPGELLKTPRDRWKEVLVLRSCRGSVMVNEPMALEKIQYLLDSLFALGCPLTCPHGRPIVFTLQTSEILGRFGRK
ncbi:MAG: DNA mismatch repair endonuclease MutL [Acidobacteriota bacterium]